MRFSFEEKSKSFVTHSKRLLKECKISLIMKIRKILGWRTMAQLELELVVFKDESNSIPFNIDSNGDTIWATEEQMSKLFGCEIKKVSQVVKQIFIEGELEELSCMKMMPIKVLGKTVKISHYNLDVVLSVGYRISSKKATQFRQWASSVLRTYIVDGYALNEIKLSQAPQNLQKLAAEVRGLRSKEKNVYATVRESFKLFSSDYDKDSKYTRNFYAKLQDRFLYAITGKTSAEIVLERANHNEYFMGLKATKSGSITLNEAQIGKNYLDSNELYALHILCEQFLLFLESRAIQGKPLTMKGLSEKFDELIVVQGHPVFEGYKSALRERAVEHAKLELMRYRQKEKLQKKSKK